MIDAIKNYVDASLLHVERSPYEKQLLRNTNKTHVCFFGLKRGASTEGQFLMRGDIEEEIFCQQVLPIIIKGQYRHAPDTFPELRICCRDNGNPQYPVLHFQEDALWFANVAKGVCPVTFKNLNKNYY